MAADGLYTYSEMYARAEEEGRKQAAFFKDFDALSRHQQIRKFYQYHNDAIIEHGKRRDDRRIGGAGGMAIDPYSFDWEPDWKKSPPERALWHYVRCLGFPLYPQYPVLNYFLDYGDPYRKIGVEIDGREYHDEADDYIRDSKLAEAGWKIFRIPARKMYSRLERPWDEDSFYYSGDQNRLLREWLMESAEGIMYALLHKFYTKATAEEVSTWYTCDDGEGEFNGAYFLSACVTTLSQHTLQESTKNYLEGERWWE